MSTITNTPTINPASIDFNNEKEIEQLVSDNGYSICHIQHEDRREEVTLPLDELPLCKASIDFIKNKRHISNLWRHQQLAIMSVLNGNNVCVTTSTSSGKTEIFLVSCLEIIHRNPEAKILAVYPMKALNRQQCIRWQKTGLRVGRIDGEITDYHSRQTILRDNQVVVMTPDTIHAYLLANINNKVHGTSIKSFISQIAIIVIDELHLYKGLFGTNCAYLFRRLNNIRRLLRKDNTYPQYITASATLPSATEHSFNITGVKDFIEIGSKDDGSPVSSRTIYYIEPKGNTVTSSASHLIKSFTQVPHAKSITFVEGRQKTGNMANSANNSASDIFEDCSNTGIYPFRAGYESETIDKITTLMNQADFKGIISTSALEIGMDIDGVNIVIIADMPQDINSFQQRIGRAGRFGCDKSYIFIIKGDSLSSKLLFEKCGYDIKKVLPAYEPALYLENKAVQNIHALLHIGDHEDSECAMFAKRVNSSRIFDGEDYFPHSFVELCNDVISGNSSSDYDSLIQYRPHTEYQLRFFGKQYDIIPSATGSNALPQKEHIGREQIATEGYQNCLRNTLKGNKRIKEKVVSINLNTREIIVKEAKSADLSAITKSYHRALIIPNFRNEYRYETVKYGETHLFNLRVVEHDYIYGYYYIYPNKEKIYTKYKNPIRIPPLPTTGTIIFHPSFNKAGVKTSAIADIIFRAFLQLNAFDSNDIKRSGEKLYNGNEIIKVNSKFVVIYDITMLNLTRRIIEQKNLIQLFTYLKNNKEVIINTLFPERLNDDTINALDALCNDILSKMPDKSTENINSVTVLKKFTKVFYTEKDSLESLEDDDEKSKGVTAIFAQYDSSDRTTAAIIVNNNALRNIPLDFISPIEGETEYENISNS